MSIRARLRADLTSSFRNGDKVETSMLRTLIAAVDNAGAIEAEPSVDPKIGLDHDQPRRDLSEEDITLIVTRERDEVGEAVANYRRLGLEEEVLELETRLAIVNRYLPGA